MGQRQLQRWHVMKMVEVGKITLKEASEKMGVSYRQAQRIGSAIRDRGMKALFHGNRGRPSERRLPGKLCQRVLELARGLYGEFNDTHLTEVLSEREGIVLSRETVRRLRRGVGQGRNVGAEPLGIGSVGNGWPRRGRWYSGTALPMPGWARSILRAV